MILESSIADERSAVVAWSTILGNWSFTLAINQIYWEGDMMHFQIIPTAAQCQLLGVHMTMKTPDLLY